MQTDYLKSVILVARYLSFSKAADEVPCAQSSVSRQIKSIEDDLGVSLFDRSPSGGVQLTPQGRTLLPLIEKLNECSQTLLEAAGCIEKKVTTILLAVSAQIFSSANKSNLCSSMYLQHPDIQLELCDLPRDAMQAQLLEHHIDAAFFYRAIRDTEPKCPPNFGDSFRLTGISSQQLSICVSANHRFAGRESISFAELENETIIFHSDITRLFSPDGDSQHSMFLQECNRHNFSPKLLLVDRNLADNKPAMARCGRGVYPTFVPDFLKQDSSLVFIPICDAHYWAQYYLLTRNDNKKKNALASLSQFLQECVNQSQEKTKNPL